MTQKQIKIPAFLENTFCKGKSIPAKDLQQYLNEEQLNLHITYSSGLYVSRIVNPEGVPIGFASSKYIEVSVVKALNYALEYIK